MTNTKTQVYQYFDKLTVWYHQFFDFELNENFENRI